jgi:hypothetical protein
MSPKMFAARLGGLMFAVGFVALVLPITVDDAGSSVSCGSGFSGLSSEAEMRDAGHDLGATMYGTTSDSNLKGECSDAIGTRKAWGWPVGAVGAVVVLGGLLIKQPGPPQPASGAGDATPDVPPSPRT